MYHITGAGRKESKVVCVQEYEKSDLVDVELEPARAPGAPCLGNVLQSGRRPRAERHEGAR